MAGVAIPAYASPMVAMSQLGSMFQHANSVGAAFVLLTLGAGVNFGLIAWILRKYGVMKAIVWLTLLFGSILGFAYAVENPLYPSEITPPGHTHAFDMYCNPFSPHDRYLGQMVVSKLREGIQPFESVSLIVVASLAGAGLFLRVYGRRFGVDEWIERQPEPTDRPAGWADIRVPAPALGLIALLGLVAFSVIACFAYYPEANEVFEEMTILKGEVLTAASSGDRKHAEHFIPVWDDWTRRLQVGVFLREWELAPYRRMKAKIFRDRLEVLKHAVQENDREEVRELIGQVTVAYGRMRRAYLRLR